MATSDINLETSDILTCSICLEIFTKPKYLPCLHTFCESCISTYITSGFEKEDIRSIECPVCRGIVPIPKENCQPNEWAKILPLNFLIAGLIGKQNLTRAEKMCMLCERFGGKTAAKASFVCVQCADTLCDTCEKYHKSIKSSSDHDVKPLDDTFSFSDMPFDTFKNTCPTHTGKLLELYCSDHETPCCCICISIGHRKCENVVTLEDAAKGVSSSSSVQDLKKELKKIAIDVETVIANQKCNLQQFENQFETEKKSMEDIFQYLRDILNRQEQIRKAELLKVFNEKKDIIETKIAICENKKRSIENEQKLLDVIVSKASDVQLMIELKKLQSRRDQHKKDLTAEWQDLQNFNLALKNTDKSIIERPIEDACRIQCEAKPCTLMLESFGVVVDTIHEFNRFTKLGKHSLSWTVKQMLSDAIVFTVSKAVSLCGFISYGCKNGSSALDVDVKVKRGSETLASIKTSFPGMEFKDIFPNVQYEVVFIMNSKYLCNYGENGQGKVSCEGIVFKFLNSSESTNNTNVLCGQIPGFLFKKYKQ